MTVDDMSEASMGQFGRMKTSRMMADNDDELHAMADLVAELGSKMTGVGGCRVCLRPLAGFGWAAV
jgi:hypothetical protein